MIYVLITLAALIGLLLVLRIRFRLEISPDRRLLFVGLGRTGPEFDFRRGTGAMKLFGLRAGRFSLREREAKIRKTPVDEAPTSSKQKTKPVRKRSVRAIAAIVPQCLRAIGKYFIGLLKAAVVEQAEGEIEAGFGAPHLTGQLFGFYQAALAAAPGLVGRVQYIPVWTGAAFAGSVRCSVAWPVYRVVGQTWLLLWRLPVTKIVKLAIGTKEGVQDG